MNKNIMIEKVWYNKHLARIKQKAGARYTPELNVNLPISRIFDGISRNHKFYQEIREKYGELFRAFRYVSSKYENQDLQNEYEKINGKMHKFLKLLENVKEYDTRQIPWKKIGNESKIIQEDLWKFSDNLRTLRDEVKDVKAPVREDGAYQQSPSEKLNSDLHHTYETQKILRDFEQLSSGAYADLSNKPFLLLSGPAGNGKTHLLCDIAEQRLKDEKNVLPSFLLFGENFLKGNDFWEQVLSQLQIENGIKSKHQLLKELDDLGKKKQCRTLFIIDALNENIVQAPKFWRKNLSKIVKDIRKFPNIALIVSVRDGYENEVLTKEQNKLFIGEQHQGFRFNEWEAVNVFFKNFSLPLPEVPLLMPEFQSPLFLLLFCKAFEKRKNNKNKQSFRGHEGTTYIFENYVDKISKKIEDEFGIGHGPNNNIWDTIIEKIAEEMVENNNERIPQEKLVHIIQKYHPSIDAGKLIQALQINMLIVAVPRYNNGEKMDGFDIRFPFQKFSDHLIGRYIFKKFEQEFGKSNKNQITAKRFFSKRRKLGKFIAKTFNRGVIEALSIQCPEQLKGTELLEVAPFLINGDSYLAEVTRDSFIESLVWRNPKAFSKNRKNIMKIINESIVITDSSHNQLLNAFLSVAPIPNHPFNSNFLHRHLLRFPMPKRDAWWSTFLHYQYGEHESLDRLLQWAWSDQEKSHITDESIFLASTALAWFLTTPNRFVRDRATKGLVCLLENRIHIIPKILEKFKLVDDQYITERLFAVAYGCVLRNKDDKKNLKILAEFVYKEIFEGGNPPLNILIRDYARGIIEVATSSGAKIPIDKNKINPPYPSTWPKIPPNKILKEKYYPEDRKRDPNSRGFSDIWSSIMYNFGTLGDFGNYVVDSHLYPWSGRRRTNPEKRKKDIFSEFYKSLSFKQKKLLKLMTNQFSKVNLLSILENIRISTIENTDMPTKEEQEKERLREIEEQKNKMVQFEKSLSEKKKRFFRKEIKPFLDDRGSINDPFDDFNTKIAQQWIFGRTVKIGYNPKLHNKFDGEVNRYDNSGRSEHKAERIGKKYQWIAYHEFMGLVSDHFEFKNGRWSLSKSGHYDGPWDPFIRDIDPSFVLQNDSHIKSSIQLTEWASGDGHYDGWKGIKSDIKWIKSGKDLPDPKKIIQITDDKNNEWLVLEGFIGWQEKTPPEFKKYDVAVRELWYMAKSYIVKKKDAKKFHKWVESKSFMGRWMPESHDFYEVFIGEYPSANAFKSLRGKFNVWTKEGKQKGDLPVKVLVTDDSYLNKFTLDCSHDGAVSMKLPCKWIVEKMKLKHKFLDGRFYNKKGELVAIATSIFEENFPSVLLINKKALIDFLDKNGYSIFWTILGEKQMIGGNHSADDRLGRLEISGTYTISPRDMVVGKFDKKFTK